MAIQSADWDEIQKWEEVYSDRLVVVKFGGALAEDSDIVRRIAKQVAYLREKIKLKVIVVHGGGKQIDNALTEKGLTISRDEKTGLRITDKDTLDVTDYALRSLNRKIVEIFRSTNKNVLPVDLAGYQGGLIEAETHGIELGGFTGHSPEIRSNLMDCYIRCKEELVVPVIYPICRAKESYENETRINVNADEVAASIAIQMNALRLIFCTDVPGVMNKDGEMISEIFLNDVEGLIDRGIVTGGMATKLRFAGKAAERMKDRDGGVVFLNGRVSNKILDELLSDQGGGTLIRRKPKSLIRGSTLG